MLAMLEDYEKLYIMKSVVFYTIIKDEKVCWYKINRRFCENDYI